MKCDACKGYIGENVNYRKGKDGEQKCYHPSCDPGPDAPAPAPAK